MPKSPIYHYLGKNDTLGPEPTDLVVNAISEAGNDPAIYVGHITDLSIDNERDKGFFGSKLKNQRELVQDYHKRYRQFTRVYDLDNVVDKKYPLIINYQMLPKIYPIKTKHADTYRWVENILMDSIWSTAASLDTDRIQFISINAPRKLQPLSYYKDIIRNERLTDLRKIKNREDLVLIDLFKFYLNPDNDTIIGKYLPKIKNLIVAVRDDINVFYISGENLLEWAQSEDSESKKLDWIHGLFEYLLTLRPSLEETDDEVETYQERIESIKSELNTDEDTQVDDIETAILTEADELLKTNAITEGEYKGALKLATRTRNLANPIGDGKLGDVIDNMPDTDEIPKSTIPDIEVIEDKSVLDNKVKMLDSEYADKYLNPHIIRTVLGMQNEGIIITNIRRELVEDASGKTQIFSIQTKPVKGDIGTFKIEVPVVNDEGVFKMGGVDYRMNKQRGDMPIVKIEPDEVALTAAMSKMFVTRGKRKANSYPEWLYVNLLNLKELNYIKDVKVSNVSVLIDVDKLPDIYSILAKRFKTFKFNDYEFYFDYKTRSELYKGDLKKLEGEAVLVGKVGKSLILVDDTNNFTKVTDGKEVALGTFEDILGLDKTKIPVEFSEVKIKGKIVPVGVLLAYWMGIEKFFRYIGVKVEEYQPNERISTRTGIIIRFKEVKLNVICDSKLQELLVGGFTYFKSSTREVNYEELNQPKSFHHIFSSRGISVSQYTFYTRIQRMWIDPITKDLLKGMREPTNIRDLFIRSTELLTNQQHVDTTDGAYKINKGYNRFNDIIYKEIIAGINEFSRGSKTAKRTFSINPKAVRMAIAMDSGIAPVAEANPMQVSGEQERITFGGAGGRSNQSMTGKHRKFHKNDRGVISEGFTDNGKAGTILYYTANPEIENIYGVQGKSDKKELGNLLSLSTNVNPFSVKDDPKRSNFGRIQYDAWANAVGQMVMPCRTGVELTVAHKVNRKFALVSKESGSIVKVDDIGMEVLYASGKVDKVQLGRIFGSNAGKTIPHEMVTDRKVGYKFKVGEVLAWNKYFFERDWIETTQVAMFAGVPSFIALRETQGTYEDASTQSESFSKKLVSRVSHIRDILVEYDNNIKMNVKVGDEVEDDTSLANILPAGVDFTDDTSSLDYQSTTSPKSKYRGLVERIEVLYCGDVTDASSTVKSIINKGDKERKRIAEYSGEFPRGEVKDPTYFGQNFLGRNSCLVRVYITGNNEFQAGDKMGYMHALKTVSGKIYSTKYQTINGLPIDGDFSYKGILSRIVESPVYEGIANMFVRQVGLNACKVYDGESKV
ncbi:hypothetical protein TSMG0076 [Halocynthia phage JM-2012]|uniref:RNA polymerase beta subunit n=1 Tax=Halocynthia phage JM-2012 TaxID=1173297 RepID=UPI00025C6920|nr:RNA polymerase beta subunit [Halocynthia phage JM-2012]AFI55359.1 hypothetical protein TSMG0076 [Halocynthia phage JM-2012]